MPSIISPLLAVLFLLIIIRSVVLHENPRDQLKLLESFNDYSMNWLHDFVRRGKGSVSKLPFEEIFIEQSDSDTSSISTAANTLDEIAEANANVVQIGGDFNMAIGSGSKALSISTDAPKISKKSRIILSATTTSSSPTATLTSRIETAKTEANSSQLKNVSKKMEFDFKRLAWLLQQAIDKRKTKKNQIRKENEMKQNIRLKNESLLGERIRSSFQQNTFSVSDLRPIQLFYHHLNPDRRSESNNAISRNLETKEAKKMYENGNHPAGNEALKRSSRYSHKILGPIRITQRKKDYYMVPSQTALSASETHANDDPMIYIIREGSIVRSKENDHEFVSSITLVIDNGEKILVDTGLATDINGRTWILQRLSELGAPPPSINYVITTHGHPDHSGNTNHFPDAFHYASKFMHFGTHFNFSRIPEDNAKKLTKNVHLLKTPGHTSDDISVLINNTSFFGTVVVSGDVFIRKEDMKYPTIWKQLAANETQQQESRKRLMCLANCIIPGHGPLFRVTSNMKRELNCPGSY